MKKIIATPFILLLILILAAFAPPARGQMAYNYLSLTGTNYMPIYRNFGVQSNLVLVQVQAMNLIVTNISTNQSITIGYLTQPTGATGTNLVSMTTLTTNFTIANGFTNGSTWIYPLPAYSAYVGLSPWGMFASSNGATATGSWTNGVNIQ